MNIFLYSYIPIISRGSWKEREMCEKDSVERFSWHILENLSSPIKSGLRLTEHLDDIFCCQSQLTGFKRWPNAYGCSSELPCKPPNGLGENTSIEFMYNKYTFFAEPGKKVLCLSAALDSSSLIAVHGAHRFNLINRSPQATTQWARRCWHQQCEPLSHLCQLQTPWCAPGRRSPK